LVLLSGDYGLAFPLRARLETLSHAGNGVLRGSFERGLANCDARNPQQRPGQPVHRRGISECFETTSGDPDQHGRAGPLLRQYLQREAVAQREVRGGLSQRLLVLPGSRGILKRVFPNLQLRETAPEPELPNTRRSVFLKSNYQFQYPKGRNQKSNL